MNVSIISPEKTIFSGSVESIRLPGKKGSFTVLDHHAPLISELDPGVAIAGDNIWVIDEGFAEVKEGHVYVLVEGADSINDIDIEKDQKDLEDLLTKEISGDDAIAGHSKKIEKLRSRISAKKTYAS